MNAKEAVRKLVARCVLDHDRDGYPPGPTNEADAEAIIQQCIDDAVEKAAVKVAQLGSITERVIDRSQAVDTIREMKSNGQANSKTM